MNDTLRLQSETYTLDARDAMELQIVNYVSGQQTTTVFELVEAVKRSRYEWHWIKIQYVVLRIDSLVRRGVLRFEV